MNIFTKPSYYTLLLNGFFILLIIIIIIRNFSSIYELDIYNQIMIYGLLGLLFGIHGLLHIGLDYAYNYNPLKPNIIEENKC
jgi:hypothetical protein